MGRCSRALNGYSSFEELGLVVNLVASLTAHCFDLVAEGYYLAGLIVDSSLHVAGKPSLSCF